MDYENKPYNINSEPNYKPPPNLNEKHSQNIAPETASTDIDV